jgi:hypothetical protein
MNRTARQLYWQTIFEKWQAGRLTLKAFCEQEHIPRSKFYYWYKRHDSGSRQTISCKTNSVPSAKAEVPPTPNFIEVQMTMPHPVPVFCGGYEVGLRGGRSVRIPAGFDEKEFERLIRLLEAIC